MSDLQKVFDDMHERFNAEAAFGVHAVLQFEISEGEVWVVTVQDEQCTVSEGQTEDPTVTLKLDTETLKEVLSGETDGMQAFMAGRIQAEGDIILATRLAEIFPIA
ncbi:MAG: SCP2 sterol-binding domain-containing protein [Neptuniibacter sp.]